MSRLRFCLPLLAALLLGACSAHRTADDRTIYVSIPPLKSLVGAITEADFPIEVLVPAGASPETFEPTPKQYIAVQRAQWLFQIGLLDFERVLSAKIADPARVVDLHTGIELLEGSCSHQHEAGHHHSHGIDPHLWTSPRALQQMAATLFRTIEAAYPDSVRYRTNYERLQRTLADLDARTAERLAASGVRSVFLYHPALTYYVRDYGLQQIAIEQEGKEPSARHLARLIRQAREEGVRRILYQIQFPKSTVEAIAADIGAEAAPFDPLGEDAVANIDAVTALITNR